MITLVPEGPKIPEEIAQALRYDNLVFFCGAGISVSNGLPPFDKLAKKVCKNLKLNIKDDLLLKIAKKKGDYASIFDLLESGQIPHLSIKPEVVRKEVIEILSTYKGQPEIHKALLELSTLPNNTGNRLVTTNFDRLFLKAKPTLSFDSAPKLAPPRKKTWKNLTFLHGVIDKKNDPEGKNLILSKTDFGLAYLLHYNWASRFIIHLFQDFTVLFIGYSADDPVMNYLVSAISYENKRRRENEGAGNHKEISKKKKKTNPSIYAFVGHKEGEKEKKENKWKSIGVEPIPYKIKEKKDHSLLYETIKEWAKLKKVGLAGRRIWLKQQLEKPYKEEIDKQKAETVISTLRMDEKLAKYLPEIDLSSDPKKRKPVDISWLKAFAEEKKEPKDENQTNSLSFSTEFESQTENSLLKKLTRRTARSQPYYLWEPLSSIEKNVAQWLLSHLDKKELIHWLIEQAPIQTGLISLHPEFQNMIKYHLKHIQENANETLDERKALFWKIISTQKNQLQDTESYTLGILINDLNNTYSYEKAIKLLSYLEPMVGFEKSVYNEMFKDITGPDKIYEAKLTINASDYPHGRLINEKTLLSHAEDFSNLLKESMELAKFAKIIQNDYDNSDIYRSAIDWQNITDDSWTYLINLVRDSFDLAMKKNKKLAKFLLNKWQFYPYSIFYRLILYAVTRYSKKPLFLSEEIAIKLFEEKPDKTLWSSSCKNEVLKFLRGRKHSKKTIQKILPLIMKGPSQLEGIEDTIFLEYKERYIYLRLHHLKLSGVQFPEDIKKFYKELPAKYSFTPSTKEEAEREGFSFYIGEPTQIGSERRYHNMTCEEIFEEIRHTEPNTSPSLADKKENFRFLVRDLPDKAFKVLCMFSEDDINSSPYWGVFISEISMITDIQKSNDYFFKSFEKIENFNDDFFKECLSSLIYEFNLKGGLIYHKDEERFQKWWKRLWNLSLIKEDNNDSDISFNALNSHLGKLSQAVFHILWSKFPDRKIKKNGKIPEDIKEYFHIIIQEGIKKDPSALYHFGSYLWSLWFLDKEWTKANIKSLMDWKKKETICKTLWLGYLHHPRWSLDFLCDFKDDFFHLILNREKCYKGNNFHKVGCRENIASTLFIATGGREIKNIFTKKETKKLIQSMDKNILESISRQIWHLLKDSRGKSANLWSEKIKPWIKNFWPPQTDKMSHKTAENLSFAILHCGNKLPEAFKDLKDKIKGVINQNSNYIAYYIIKNEEDGIENNKQDLEYIYDYPKELLQILNWNFPENNYDKKIEKILNKLKSKYRDIENDEQYQELLKKIT